MSFVLSSFFIYQIIADVRIDIKKIRETEKNIKDIYQYNQLLDPPSMHN
jgi:hypothetical protein